jgi:cytochrome c556
MFSDTNNTFSVNDFSIEIESLYIAHVFPNIHKKKIAQLFEKLFLANIKGIDFVTKIGKDGKPYNSAYVHIESWFDTSAAKHFQEKIRSDSEALLVYDEPWYWIVNENISREKSKFIQKAEEEKFEETQQQSSSLFKEMQMMLDNLEKLCAENKRELNILKQNDKKEENYEEIYNENICIFIENDLREFTEEEEYQILKELRFQQHDEEQDQEEK